MRKPSPLFRGLVTPGIWLVRLRCRYLARLYFLALEPLLRLLLQRPTS